MARNHYLVAVSSTDRWPWIGHRFKLAISCVGFAFILGLTVGHSLSAADAGNRPNIVIILADDLGYGDPRCYNDQSKIPTPNIDALAGQGLRCTDTHTPTSVCSPTRYGLLTGRYCWRSPLKRGVLWTWDPPLIDPERLTLPVMLKQLGYRTACIGKWHLGWRWPRHDGSYTPELFSGRPLSKKERNILGENIDFPRPANFTT